MPIDNAWVKTMPQALSIGIEEANFSLVNKIGIIIVNTNIDN